MKKILLLAFIIIGNNALAQDSLNVRTTYIWPYGPSHALDYTEIKGSKYILLGSGGGLIMLNVDAPQNPYETSRIATTGLVLGIAIYDGIAYIADGDGGLQLIDIRSPDKIKIKSSCKTKDYAKDVDIIYPYAIIADNDSGLSVFDVSNSKKPRFLTNYDTPGKASFVKISGNDIYLADNGISKNMRSDCIIDSISACLWHFKIEDNSVTNMVPTYVKKIRDIKWMDILDDMLVYETESSDIGKVELKPVNERDNTKHDLDKYILLTRRLTYRRNEYTSISIAVNVDDISINNNIAYVADRKSGLKIFNFISYDSCAMLSRYDLPGYFMHAVIKDSLLFAVNLQEDSIFNLNIINLERNALKTYRLGDDGFLRLVGIFNNSILLHRLIGNANPKFILYSLKSDSILPCNVLLDTFSKINEYYYDNDKLYFIYKNEMKIIDLNNPNIMQGIKLGFKEQLTEGNCCASRHLKNVLFKVIDNKAYFRGDGNDLLIYDISKGGRAEYVCSWMFPDLKQRIDSLLHNYVLGWDDSESLMKVVSVWYKDIWVHKGHLLMLDFLSDGMIMFEDGLRIIDNKDEKNLEQIGFYETGFINNAFLRDDEIYIGSSKGFEIIDVSVPNKPKQVGYYKPGDASYEMFAYKNKIIALCHGAGYRIFEKYNSNKE